jgi:2-amino-4-hydroxy-6-hydroxymethyldihydropteridine diphosphokinase
MFHVAYIGIGANLGDAQATVTQAIGSLAQLPKCRLTARSSLYRSAPYEASGPDFINAVVALETVLEPILLLSELQRLEQDAGREHPYRNAPRTLDLDLLMYDDLVLDTPRLTLPHPRLAQRAFVLMPLTEIAPTMISPEQLASVDGQIIERVIVPD